MFVTCREGFNMNTANENPIVFVDDGPQSSVSSPYLSESVEKYYYFPPLDDSNSFGLVDYESHIKTKQNII